MSAILTFHSKSRVENTMEKINSGLTKKKKSKISGNVYFDGVAPTLVRVLRSEISGNASKA